MKQQTAKWLPSLPLDGWVHGAALQRFAAPAIASAAIEDGSTGQRVGMFESHWPCVIAMT